VKTDRNAQQYAAPPTSHTNLIPKKKLWGSRDFPWIDEDLKDMFA
jgi:hypothetical protein